MHPVPVHCDAITYSELFNNYFLYNYREYFRQIWWKWGLSTLYWTKSAKKLPHYSIKSKKLPRSFPATVWIWNEFKMTAAFYFCCCCQKYCRYNLLQRVGSVSRVSLVKTTKTKAKLPNAIFKRFLILAYNFWCTRGVGAFFGWFVSTKGCWFRWWCQILVVVGS